MPVFLSTDVKKRPTAIIRLQNQLNISLLKETNNNTYNQYDNNNKATNIITTQ